MPANALKELGFRTASSSSCRTTATNAAAMTASPASRCSKRWARNTGRSISDTVRDRLKPGCNATLQIITVADQRWQVYKRGVDFIQKYIFPGGMLPSPSVLRQQIANAGLQVARSVEFGHSYDITLRRWHETFNEKWDQIAEMGFDERFRRMWNFYLTSCAAAFDNATVDVTQITVTRPS